MSETLIRWWEVEGYPLGTRGYRIVPPESVVKPYRHDSDKADVVRGFVAQPCGVPATLYFATEEDAEECLRGVLEGLR